MFAASKSGSAEVADAQFNYVTMLLHGDGTNGAQNNTFLDSSTNNFTITRNGNTTQGTFTPYGSNWSNYFGIATSDLKFASNAAFGVGTGNFSIEFFVNISEWAGHQRFFMTGDSGLDAIQLGRPFADSIGLDMNNGRIITYSWVPNIGQWYHIALVRSGTGTNQITLYIDGTSVATGTSSYSVPAKDAFVGGNDWNTDRSCRGYISNMRFSNTARTITVPTSAYTSDANTLILTCQSNRFIDNSSNGFPAIAQGSPSVQRFSPFSPTTAYSTSVIGGSGYFDGSGDYLNVASNAAFGYGTGDFSLEFWAYPSALSDNNRVIFHTDDNFNLELVGSGVLQFFSGSGRSSSPYTYSAKAWSHFAITRQSGTARMFINGMLVNNFAFTSSKGTSALQLGANAGSSQFFGGYLSNIRIVKGGIPSAYVTASTTNGTQIFTPPTAPFTSSDSLTAGSASLLLNYTNAGIIDNAMMNDLETVGNAQISTSVKKYGTGSMYFDGNGDNLSGPTTPDLNMGTGNWTIECWVYILSRTLNYPLIFGNNNGGYTAGALSLVNSNADSGASTDRFCLSVKDISSAPTLVASSTNSSNTWYHLAVVRNGTSLVMYIDGTSVASVTISSSIVFDWGKLGSRIGGGNWDGAQSYFNGYIDDLRVTKGVARYTATFTPPTTAFADRG